MVKERFRLQFKFWLDVNKPDEFELAEMLDTLKEKHLYASSIRDGLRLIHSLREGRLDILFALFPWIEDELKAQITLPDNAQLYEEIETIKDLIIRQLQAGTSPRVGGTTPFPTLDFDDIKLDIVEDNEASATETRDNFRSSMGDLFAGDEDEDLWDD